MLRNILQRFSVFAQNLLSLLLQNVSFASCHFVFQFIVVVRLEIDFASFRLSLLMSISSAVVWVVQPSHVIQRSVPEPFIFITKTKFLFFVNTHLSLCITHFLSVETSIHVAKLFQSSHQTIINYLWKQTLNLSF